MERGTLRQQAYQVLGRQCVLCDYSYGDCAHLKAAKAGGEHSLLNVVILCPNHHRDFDQGRLSEENVRKAWVATCLPKIEAFRMLKPSNDVEVFSETVSVSIEAPNQPETPLISKA
jgi:hypothetical protein